MHPLSLDHITVLPAGPIELIDIAAALGCPLVSLRAAAEYDSSPLFDLRTDAALVREVRARCKASAVRITTLLALRLSAGVEFDVHRRMLDLAVELGALNVLVVSQDLDRGRQRDYFLRLCDEAGARGVGVALEHVSYYALQTLPEALELVHLANQPHVGLVADVLHLYRSGGRVADLALAEPRLFRHAQICDGPLILDPARRAGEASLNRLAPGDGELPLLEFVRALPEGVPLGIEVPQQGLRKRGIPPRARAEHLIAATNALLRAAGR